VGIPGKNRGLEYYKMADAAGWRGNQEGLIRAGLCVTRQGSKKHSALLGAE